jgi:cupin fold WbuC family metalloprotein
MKIITEDMLDNLNAQARESSRLRRNLNLHPVLEDPVQRFLNALEPGTYTRPHRHAGSDRWELFIILAGATSVLIFDDNGTVTRRIELDHHGAARAIEIPGNTWHTVVCRAPGTILFEIKRGPYDPISDKNFAPWAPAEGESGTDEFLRWYRDCAVGSRPPVRG